MTKDLITELEYLLIQAIKSSDVSFLDTILHEDLLFIIPGGQTITKQMDLDSHRARQMVVEKLVPSFEEIRIIGDIAIVVVIYDTKGRMMDTPIEGKFKYIRYWKKFPEGPKIIGGSCTALG
jgi:ACR3 family arsenite efflux pump ArsB